MFFEKLKLFNALVTAGNFSKLADSQKLSLSFVSRRISSLEEEIGHKLIIRNFRAGPIKLTRPGEIFYKTVPLLVDTYESLLNLMNNDPNLEAGKINIYTTASIIEDWLVPMLSNFKIQLPNIKLNFITDDYLIDSQKLGSIISITPYNSESTHLIQLPLLKFHSSLWASKTYIKRYGLPENLEDLQRHHFLSFTKDFDHKSYPTLNWHINRANIPLDNVTCINTTAGLVRAAAEGQGILSLSLESIMAKNYEFVRILPEINGPIVIMCFTYPAYWKDNLSLNKTGKFIREYFKNINTDNTKKFAQLTSATAEA